MKLKTMLAFAGGLVAGGLMVMMIAPCSGKEMCENLRKKMADAKKCVDDAMEKCHAHGCGGGSCSVDGSDTMSLEE